MHRLDYGMEDQRRPLLRMMNYYRRHSEGTPDRRSTVLDATAGRVQSASSIPPQRIHSAIQGS